jgi:hypothetical protein
MRMHIVRELDSFLHQLRRCGVLDAGAEGDPSAKIISFGAVIKRELGQTESRASAQG